MTGIPDLPDLWIISELGDQLTRSDERIDPARKPNEKYLYVGLEDIESDTGRLMEAPEVFGSEIKSTKNIFKPGDILYGKLRPYLNKVHLAETNGICSTDLWVLRSASTIDPVYAAHYLRSAHVLQRVSQLATGANLPRVSGAAFDVIPVPLPPLPEQGRIAAILQQADGLRQMRREANEKGRKLSLALFIDMFGDPVKNSMDWKKIPFGDVCETRLGKMLDQKRQTGLNRRPYLRNFNVQWGYFDLSNVAEMDFDELERAELQLQKGDVLICEGGEVGRSAVWNNELPECYFQKAIHRARPHSDLANSDYIAHLMWALSKSSGFADFTSQATIAHLTGVQLRSLVIPIPPLDLQHQFAERVAEISILLQKQSEAHDQFDRIFKSLLVQGFTGELTTSWREAHRAELARAAEGMRQRLEEKKRPAEPIRAEITTDETLKESLSNFNLVAKALAQRIREAVDEFFARHTGEAFNMALTPTMVPQFFHLADILKPYTNSLAESLNEGLRQQISEIRNPDTNILAFGLIPLAESLRQQSQLYYADLLLKMSQLTRLQLGESLTRTELQEAIGQVIEQLPQYWTLVDLAEDWRVNHLPRNTVREIVDMLVVMGQLRETTIRHETEDRQQASHFIRAYTRVLDSERVTAAEIQL